jgi:hypothetical protein
VNPIGLAEEGLLRSTSLGGIPDRADQKIRVEVILEEEIDRASLGSQHRRAAEIRVRQRDHGNSRGTVSEPVDGIKTRGIREREIKEGNIVRLRAMTLQGGIQAGGMGHRAIQECPNRIEHRSDELDIQGIVLDEENAEWLPSVGARTLHRSA